MSLPSGLRVGPYEIIAPLGAGGMGEVYRAKDARLGRDVAIKVLPEAVASDAARRERFEREAKAVAALSHPNIINVFDTGLHDGHPFVVMELLEGDTLRERLASGALPVRKAVEIAVQIARGLGAAHDKQIVHRDLKPENIFVLRDGQVKILDFGLAREIATNHSGGTETRAAITDAGIAMGTVGYMAPEQIRAQPVDGRTDLFAFGAVLFEMLAGTRAFQRDTSAETMTAILKEDAPDLLASHAQIPPSLDRIVRHCLEKNPAERFQSARDVAFALDALSGSSTSAFKTASGAAVAEHRARLRWIMPSISAALVVAAAALGVMVGRRQAPGETSIDFERKTYVGQRIPRARFMPDGQTIILNIGATFGDQPDLYSIRPGSVIPQRLIGRAQLLSISSRGELAVLTPASDDPHDRNTVLSRMAIDGAPRAWLDNVIDADWAPNGSDIAVARNVNGRPQIEYPAGTVLFTGAGGYMSNVRVSPSGDAVAFMEHQFVGDNRGWVKLVDRNGAVRTLAGEFDALNGLVWLRDGGAFVFGASRKQSGSAYQTLEVNVSGPPRVRQYLGNSSTLFLEDMAADGSMLCNEFEMTLGIRVLLPGESAERDVSWLGGGLFARVSDDGKKIVFQDQGPSAGPSYQVALRDVASGNVVRLGSGASWGLSPDGKWAGATIMGSGQNVLYPTGAGSPVELPRGGIENYDMLPRWFADGRQIYFCGREKGRAPRCYQQQTSGGAPKPITGDGVGLALLADDQQTLLMLQQSGATVGRIGSSEATPAKGLQPGDKPLTWMPDGKAVVVTTLGKDGAVLAIRVDIYTGQRTTLRSVKVAEASATTLFDTWRADGRSYSYSYANYRNDLYVATRVREK